MAAITPEEPEQPERKPRRKQIRHDTDTLQAYADKGYTLAEIGEDLGVHPDAVRAAARRRGITIVQEKDRSIRQRVQDMDAEEAVEYLLEAVERLTSALIPYEHLVDSWDIELAYRERKFLIVLVDAPGLMTKQQLLDAHTFNEIGDIPDIKIVDVMVCKLRKKLPEKYGTIKTSWGVGYWFEPGEAFDNGNGES